INEPAAQQVFADGFHLGVGEQPVAHFTRDEPGPVEEVVEIIRVRGLLHAAGVDARQAAQRASEMPVGAGIVLRPRRAAFAPIHAAAEEPARKTGFGVIGVHQASLDPFGLLLPVLGHVYVVVGLHRYVELERLLRSEHANQKCGSSQDEDSLSRNHEVSPWSKDSMGLPLPDRPRLYWAIETI